MHTSVHVNNCLTRNLSDGQASPGTTNTRFINYRTNSFTTIIIVPLSEILDNIYQLLTHGPVCQSSRSFTSLQRIRTSQVNFNNWR